MQISTNMPGIGLVIRDIAFEIVRKQKDLISKIKACVQSISSLLLDGII